MYRLPIGTNDCTFGPCMLRSTAAALAHLPSNSRRRTSGRYLGASGVGSGLTGPPPHSVSSLRLSVSSPTPPYTITPMLPLPSGRASSKRVAGLS